MVVQRVSTLVAVLMALVLVTWLAPAPVRAQKANIVLIPGTATLGSAQQVALRKALNIAAVYLPTNMHYAAVTAVSAPDGWYLVSVAGFAQVKPNQSWSLEESVWIGLLLMTQLPDGTWQVAVQGTPDFNTLLANVPDGVLSAGARANLSPAHPMLASTETYRFPWATGASMMYAILGIHSGGFFAGYEAVDFLSDGNTSAGHAPNQLLAAASGSIDYVCNDGTSVAIRIGQLLYAHLLNNANLVSGYTLNQGDVLGQLKAGTFSASCGYANQGTDWFHVHWAFPDTGSFQAGGWTLLDSDQMWHRGSQTISTTQWMLSEAVTWSVQYFTDQTLNTSCYIGTEDAAYQFKQWFASAPASGCPASTFGARFTKQVSFQGGTYTMHLQRAGQARVLMDGQTLLDLWQSGDGGQDATLALTGTHEVQVEFAGTATLSPALGVWWYGPGALPAAPPTDPSSWRVEYYGNQTLWGQPALVQNEGGDGINHAWGETGPGYSLPDYSWSARFSRDVAFSCGTYRFGIFVDDGVRLWVGDQLLIDQWQDQVASFTADISLTGGSVPVKVEYYQHNGGAALTVNWQLLDTTACGNVLPDLQPYTPTIWAGSVVASPVPGSRISSTLLAGQTTYFSWAIVNDGYAGTSTDFPVELWLDNEHRATFNAYSLEAGLIETVQDWATVVVTPGLHTIRLVIDPANTVNELDKMNNTWQGTFYWQAATMSQPAGALPLFVPVLSDGGD